MSRVSPKVLALLGLLTLVWGTNWPLFRIALDELPVWTFRTIVLSAAVIMLTLILIVRRESFAVPKGKWLPLIAASAMNIGVWNIATSFAVLYIPSGHASVLAYTMPLWVAANLLVGRHCHATTQMWQEMLFLPSVRRAEKEHRRKVEEVIEFLDLQAYRDKLIAGLPYGVRKVIEVARALCSEPKLILLDEPSSGLNVEETDDMSFWIRDIRTELGITVLMVEHDMTLVNRVSDRVLALNYGKVLATGTPAEVQAHPDVIAAYLGA
jgi:ABC-type sugar transport system ATPase subunit